jgi:hypothetical protein
VLARKCPCKHNGQISNCSLYLSFDENGFCKTDFEQKLVSAKRIVSTKLVSAKASFSKTRIVSAKQDKLFSKRRS